MSWWREAVYYQVYPRSFADSNGDGVGDLPGVTGKLDYLANTLGIDVVWLSPFYRSPMHDMGYDVSDYCAVDPTFGTLEDFDALIARAHELGLKIIIDFVPNHTSIEHPWFAESASSRDNPKADWYIWADGKDGGPPNNWLSIFGGPSWRFHVGRNQFYLHSFLPEQPDLNWRNPEVEQAMFDAISFWLDRDVDGFRIDVAHFILKDPELRDNPANTDNITVYHKPVGAYEEQLHVHDINHPDTHELYARLRKLVAERPKDPVLVGEIHLQDVDVWARYYGTSERPELNLPFNFGLLGIPLEAGAIAHHVAEIERATQGRGWPTYVLGNHDEQRLRTRIGDDYYRAAAVLLLTLRGAPTLYYGDEIGMVDGFVPEEKRLDPWGFRVPGHDLWRDGCRTPMQWSGDPGAGFTQDAIEPWLPIAADFETRNVEAQLGQKDSTLELYRALIKLRKAHPVLRRGGIVAIEARDGVLSYERVDDDSCMGVEMNLAPTDRPSRFSGAGHTLLWVTRTNFERDIDARTDSLEPGEARVTLLKE